MTLRERIKDAEGIFNISTPAEVIRYLDEGNTDAAAELLGNEAHVHSSCMNAGRADTFWDLAEDCHGAAMHP